MASSSFNASSRPAEIPPKERALVEQLIATGDSGRAVELAKGINQRLHSPASEALLFDAYGARLRTLLSRHLGREARNLVDFVVGRYPSAASRLPEWNAILAGHQGAFDTLLAPLSDPSLAPERVRQIHSVIRRDVTDLGAIATADPLPADHPLRVAAKVLSDAFAAVTTGPVADDALALPEVSRQSPLAPWKMLIRAIAAYYRRDDAACEKYLAAVDPDSAPARLVSPIRSLIQPSITNPLTPAFTKLIKQTGGLETLRATLKTLDQAFERKKDAQTLTEIGHAITACEQSEPQLLIRLRQHISIRAMLAGLKPQSVEKAMRGPSLKNAHFWRLLARSTEEEKRNPVAVPMACSYWEEFRRHAVHENWFPKQGSEVAAVYLHMADLWGTISPDEVNDIRHLFISAHRNHNSYYGGQPPEIRAVGVQTGSPDPYYLSQFRTLGRACEADPCSENFSRWLRHAMQDESGESDESDSVAEQWAESQPNDIPPLLHLMESAEKRNALQKAFKFMERAERIDGVNAEVRRARLRLLVSMTLRHLKSRKPHLAEKDMVELEALPQSKQGDRPAFLAALRWAISHAGGAADKRDSLRTEVVRLMGGEVAAQVVLENLTVACNLRILVSGAAPKKGTPLAEAIGRACALGDDLGQAFSISSNLLDPLGKEVASKTFTGAAIPLIALGEAAIRQELLKMGYAIAGAGLAQGPEGQARFLYLRARAMPPWEPERRETCLAAASELARRQRDTDLLNRIGQWREDEMDWMDGPSTATQMDSDDIALAVQEEAKLRGYPKEPRASRGNESCDCPECRAKRFGMPPELVEMMNELGPEGMAEAISELLNPGGKKGRRRRPIFGDDDVPF